MTFVEDVILVEKPDVTMIYGDVNSTLAAVVTSSKLKIPTVHIEAGVRSYDMFNPEEINLRVADVLAGMRDVLHHHGPDDEGIFIDGNLGLGHKRLSVIDLSPRDHRPMSNNSGSLIISYNGEIYNYRELREDLEKDGFSFRSQTDTEVVLLMYEKYGSYCLDYLNGMFAFAIWDTVKRRLFLARDPLGIKPLYYYTGRNGFFFASEIKSVLCSHAVSAELDSTALADYLTFQYVLGEKTLFRNIKKLIPGHVLTVEEGGRQSIERYWAPSFEKLHHNNDEAANRLSELLENSIRIQLRNDIPLGGNLGLQVTSQIAYYYHCSKEVLRKKRFCRDRYGITRK